MPVLAQGANVDSINSQIFALLVLVAILACVLNALGVPLFRGPL